MKNNISQFIDQVVPQDNSKDFTALTIKIASPDDIRSWSYGEVKKAETINYRSNKPEPDGLFCQKIFGPVKDFECHCGSFKNNKQYRGQICSKCGVEVTNKAVRRERMGHVELAAPCVHIWYLKSLPGRIAMVLDMPMGEVEAITYLTKYVILDPGNNDEFNYNQVIEESVHENLMRKVQEGTMSPIVSKSGGEAILELLKSLDIKDEIEHLTNALATCKSETKRAKYTKRLVLLKEFEKSKNKPEWMVLTALPILPPELRPLVPLDGGRFATADLNELYRKVIIRNNTLKKVLDMHAASPEILVRQSKRLLQEAVDCLIDNARCVQPATANNKRPLKSLSDVIKGKKGRFRQNLLGKRVDYSGRSVISVGPYLRLHQCGLPKQMAKELFKPFIFSKLIENGVCDNLKSCRKVFDREDKEVWDALDQVVKQHPVLLNRAPTLHRLGIQAFEPVLIEGKVIQLHPLVCSAFNADFDGDQMAVHVPLTLEAQLEARVLMMANNNILSPASGEAIIVPSQDMVLGTYYMTRELKNVKGDGCIFASPKHAEVAYQTDEVSLHAKVKVRINYYEPINEENQDSIHSNDDPNVPEGYVSKTEVVDTTVGRAILWQIAPKELSFKELFNRAIGKKEIARILNTCYRKLGNDKTVTLADQIMYTGFKYAAISGSSIGIYDMKIPDTKKEIIAAARAQEAKDKAQKTQTTRDELRNRLIDLWNKTGDKLTKEMQKHMKYEMLPDQDGVLHEQESMNSLYLMSESGARGSVANVKQLASMRGLMVRPDGTIIETPITSNFREGLNVQEYFISTHGARKGLADTALKTANSGYLTRRLVDVAQDVIITEEDCGTKEALTMTPVIEGDKVKVELSERILGRVLARDIEDKDGKLLLKKGELITEDNISIIKENNIAKAYIRSPTLCESKSGICVKCYGLDLARNQMISEGEAVGIIAAQSIGEPGTQLTMRTIHSGGIAQGGSETSVAKSSTNGTVKVDIPGKKFIFNENGQMVITEQKAFINVFDEKGVQTESHRVPYGTVLNIKDNSTVSKGTILAEWDVLTKPLLTEVEGYVKFEDFIDNVTISRKEEDTGLSTITIVENSKRPQSGRDKKPAIVIVDANGDPILLPNGSQARYFIPDKSNVEQDILEFAKVYPGTILSRSLLNKQSSNDITGGLPRVADLFEARKPKDPAILAEISGNIVMGTETKGKYRLRIVPDNADDANNSTESWEVLIPKHRLLNVNEGEHVNKGDVLVDGPESASDLLRLKGIEELTHYIVDEVQQVYRMQGVKISDKHIEVIIRQMLRKVEITYAADSEFIEGQEVDINIVNRENALRNKLGYEAIQFKRKLLGLTKASLATESFISAASFQETTRVLVDAAIKNKVDELKGLKENVIIGRLIPSGTGYQSYKQRNVKKFKKSIIESLR